MSRLAKKPIRIPEGANVRSAAGKVFVKGPKGELEINLPRGAEVAAENGEVSVKPASLAKQGRASAGTAWALVRNALIGVTQGFQKNLEIEGVGYKAALDGDTLVLSLGYVNPVRLKVPPGISVSVDKNVISVSGVNKELVGLVAARIRKLKKPEPYKGKGIRYQGEVIRRKVGKKAAAAGAA
jgi:large subunit ribosomal protein L6